MQEQSVKSEKKGEEGGQKRRAARTGGSVKGSPVLPQELQRETVPVDFERLPCFGCHLRGYHCIAETALEPDNFEESLHGREKQRNGAILCGMLPQR